MRSARTSKYLQRHGPNSRQERAFWRTRLLSNVLSAKLAARLVGLRRLFDAKGKPGAADPNGGGVTEVGSFDAIFAAAEAYRGKDVYLAVSMDGKAEVLAADADGEKVLRAAKATGRKYIFMCSPPPAGAPVEIPTPVDAG